MRVFERAGYVAAWLSTGFLTIGAIQYIALDIGNFGPVASAVLLLLMCFFFPSTVCAIRRMPENDDWLTTMNLVLGLITAASMGLMWIIFGAEARETIAMLASAAMWLMLLFYPGDGARHSQAPRDPRDTRP